MYWVIIVLHRRNYISTYLDWILLTLLELFSIYNSIILSEVSNLNKFCLLFLFVVILSIFVVFVEIKFLFLFCFYCSLQLKAVWKKIFPKIFVWLFTFSLRFLVILQIFQTDFNRHLFNFLKFYGNYQKSSTVISDRIYDKIIK